MASRQNILVLCTGNSCRSQMAEGFVRKYHGDQFNVHSAGTSPKDEVHPLAVEAMNEVGVDIATHRPKDLTAFLGKLPLTHLLIVCDRANDSCPRVWPGSLSRTFMPFDDPAHATGSDEEIMQMFRRVRDEIDVAMNAWRPPASK